MKRRGKQLFRQCAYLGCGRRFRPRANNPRQRFHSSACRVAAWRMFRRDGVAVESKG